MKYFTADPHLLHEGILNIRPFKSTDEQTEVIVKNWNTVVTSGDIVYVLGDVALPKNPKLRVSEIENILYQLNGQKFLILGNHDLKNKALLALYKKVFVKVVDVLYIKEQRQKIFLSHYAHRCWRASMHGSWHLFGHSHGSLLQHGKSFDVGMDLWNFTPVSFDRIKESMDLIEEIIE